MIIGIFRFTGELKLDIDLEKRSWRPFPAWNKAGQIGLRARKTVTLRVIPTADFSGVDAP
jgi:hypothetical protein